MRVTTEKSGRLGRRRNERFALPVRSPPTSTRSATAVHDCDFEQLISGGSVVTDLGRAPTATRARTGTDRNAGSTDRNAGGEFRDTSRCIRAREILLRAAIHAASPALARDLRIQRPRASSDIRPLTEHEALMITEYEQ